MAADLKVFGLNCSLKSSKAKESSSTDVLLRQVFDALAEHGAAASSCAPPTTTSSRA